MDINETIEVLALLKVAYPNGFSNMSPKDYESMANLWCIQFGSEDSKTVNVAVQDYIATDTTGFLPAIGQIKQRIRLMRKSDELTAEQAASIIKRAVSNSGYHSVEEFQKLPDKIKSLVGSPGRLKAWGSMSMYGFESELKELKKEWESILEQDRVKAQMLTAEGVKQLC